MTGLAPVYQFSITLYGRCHLLCIALTTMWASIDVHDLVW